MVMQKCQWGKCRSDTRQSHQEWMKGVKFYRLPDPRPITDETTPKYMDCKAWIKACGLKEECNLTIERVAHDWEKKLRYLTICSKVSIARVYMEDNYRSVSLC